MKRLAYLLIALCMIPLLNAEVQTLGTFKQNTEVTLIQLCTNSTYSNITSVVRPDGTFAVGEDITMTKQGNRYTSTFTDTSSLGTYTVYGHCDEDRTDTNWGYTFEIASENRETTDLAYVLVWILSFALLIAFFMFSRKVPLYRLTTSIMMMLDTFIGFYIMDSPIASFISFIGIIFMFKETLYFMNSVVEG